MDKKYKNKIGSEHDFLRYRNGKMTGEERNSFEKELQKDHFAEEAAEGFSTITAEEAEKDLSGLKKSLERRTGRRTVTIRYRIAAAAAVLVAVSVIFYNRTTEQELTLSKNSPEEVKTPMVIAASEPVMDKTEKSRVQSELKRDAIPDSAPLPVSPAPIIPDNEQLAVSVDLKESEKAADEDNNFAQPAKTEKKMEMARAADDAVPMASKSSFSDHSAPQPVTGIDSFNIYLEKNIRNPQPENENEEFVIISFVVQPDSTIGDIRIIESPGKAYSNEVIRLIEKGPRWKPAFENGVGVKEEYRLRVVFR
jgi:hypothetical protein